MKGNDGQLLGKEWWAGTGLNRRHQDFQSYSPIRVSARNCLMWNATVATTSYAGVCWNDQECAGVGHNLGTNRSGSYSITRSARARIDCGILIPSALAVFRFTTSSNLVGCATGKFAGLAPFRT